MAELREINGVRVLAQEIPVEIPTFEETRVTLNIFASSKQVDRFVRTMGGLDTSEEGKVIKTHEGVVLEVTGWPAHLAGVDPFGEESPSIFRAWVSRLGMGRAMRLFITDPNS